MADNRKHQIGTSQGGSATLCVKVWGTAELSKQRLSRSSDGPKKLTPIGRMSSKSKRGSHGRRGSTELSAFHLSSRRGRGGGFDFDEASISARDLFSSTWRLLDEEERDFASALFLQCWWRRWLYRERPEMLAKYRVRTMTLLDALQTAVTAMCAVDATTGKTLFALAAKPRDEVERDMASELEFYKALSRRNSIAMLDEVRASDDVSHKDLTA